MTFFLFAKKYLVCSSPVNHLLRWFSTTYASICNLFLLKRHTTAGHTKLLFYQILTALLAAPHCFYKTGLLGKEFLELREIFCHVGVLLSVSSCSLQHFHLDGLHQFANLCLQIFQSNLNLLSGVTTADDALSCFNILAPMAEIIIGKTAAKESRAYYNADPKGGLMVWGPTVDLARDPRWGRNEECYGEDPFLTSRLGVAFVKGMQGEGEFLKTAACAKHFAVHSGPEAVRHHFDAIANPKDMEETYLPAFKALVTEAKVEGVMGAYNRVNGEAACASPFLMNKLKEWGFDGYFVSDCWAIRDFHTNHGLTTTAPESAALALKAGCDLNCGNTYLHMLTALEENLVSPEDIRNACVHLMRTRARLGMFEESTEFDNIPYDVVSCKEHKAVSLESAEKSMVLLKNNGILPLDKNKIRSIAIIGPNADSREALEGNYCGKADEYITFLDGIRRSFDGNIYYSEGADLFKDRVMALGREDDRLAEAVIAAQKADVVIVCTGLNATIEGEEGDTGNEFCSGDKPDLRLPLSQRKLLEKIAKTGKGLQ